MVRKARTGFGFFGLCVILTVSLGTTLQKAEATDSNCCEFALPKGCASAPTAECPQANCEAALGVFKPGEECNPASGNCEAKTGFQQRVCCMSLPCGGAASMDMGACSAIMIPAVSQWGLAVMVLLVLTAGTIVVMRRRAATTT